MSRAKRVKKAVPPPEVARDTRLVALAEQAERAGWAARWIPESEETWLRLSLGDAPTTVSVFARGGRLSCLASSGNGFGTSPLEALRAAYAQLGVALDQAEDIFADESGEMA